MHLNGWQRAWLLASILWAVSLLALAGIFPIGNQIPSPNTILFLVRLWILPVAGIYALTAGIDWVRRGFTNPSQQ